MVETQVVQPEDSDCVVVEASESSPAKQEQASPTASLHTSVTEEFAEKVKISQPQPASPVKPEVPEQPPRPPATPQQQSIASQAPVQSSANQAPVQSSANQARCRAVLTRPRCRAVLARHLCKNYPSPVLKPRSRCCKKNRDMTFSILRMLISPAFSNKPGKMRRGPSSLPVVAGGAGVGGAVEAHGNA